MTKKNDKVKKVNNVSKTRVMNDQVNDAYLELNQSSFEKNFKALIGHYKSNDGYNETFVGSFSAQTSNS